MLIGLAGYAGSGKDSVCDILRFHNVIRNRYAFADPIKETVNALFRWDQRHAFGELKEVDVEIGRRRFDRDGFKGKLVKYGLDQFGYNPDYILSVFIEFFTNTRIFNHDIQYTLSPRLAYQIFGTEVGREFLDTNVWTTIAPTESVCIPDTRFPNEVEWLYENKGMVVRIDRMDITPVNPHSSESFIRDLDVDFSIQNNGDFWELEKNVMEAFDIEHTGRYLHAPIDKDPGNRLVEMQQWLRSRSCVLGEEQTLYDHGVMDGISLALRIYRGESTKESLLHRNILGSM